MVILSENDLQIYSQLADHCLQLYRSQPQTDVSYYLDELMGNEQVPMHYPFHHFILPASLLAAAAACRGETEERLSGLLQLAMERAIAVPGGSCGNYGACGAGVGAGLFMSVYTDTSPLSEASWAWANELTGLCLCAIAQIPGPRCCKRVCYLSAQAAVPYINDKLQLSLSFDPGQQCSQHQRNQECKKQLCPFYPAEKE